MMPVAHPTSFCWHHRYSVLAVSNSDLSSMFSKTPLFMSIWATVLLFCKL